MDNVTARTAPAKVMMPLAALACAVALAISMAVSTETAWAGGGTSLESIYSGTVQTAYVKGASNSPCNNIYYYSLENSGKKPSNVKSSNSSVLTAEVMTTGGQTYGSYKVPKSYPLVVHLKKAGTATLTFKHAGKSHKVKFVVKNYENPVKSLKVGKKNYASLFNVKNITMRSRADLYPVNTKSNPKGKVSVKAKKGWKLVSLKSGITTLKNGKSKANLNQLDLEFLNKKTKVVESFHVQMPYRQMSADSSLKAASVAL